MIDLSSSRSQASAGTWSREGAVQAIRNPAAHEPLKPLTTEEAMELLALASLLNRALDNAAPPGGASQG